MTPVYLDCNATTRVDSRVAEVVRFYMCDDYGNAGSRTHVWGAAASKAVDTARRLVAEPLAASPDEVIFTAGATEANNIALLGIVDYARQSGRTHVIATAVEHKAVLEPLEHLVKAWGFELTLLPVDERGWPSPDSLAAALRNETVLVSTMHVNNETGVTLPLDDYAQVLGDHDAWWHVDAAQGFGKANDALRDRRIDLISISGHKVFAPKGVGALIARRRGYERPPLAAFTYGGGQERGLRPGTVPVPLVTGLGEAARLAEQEASTRSDSCLGYRAKVLEGLGPLNPTINGDPARILPHVLNVSLPGIDAEAAMVATKDLIAISNGSACTSSSYEPSHVLTAMGLGADRIPGALRISWAHDSDEVNWTLVADRLMNLQR